MQLHSILPNNDVLGLSSYNICNVISLRCSMHTFFKRQSTGKGLMALCSILSSLAPYLLLHYHKGLSNEYGF